MTDLAALHTEVAYPIPPWCKIGNAIDCQELMAGIVAANGRYECLLCHYHNREAGNYPNKRMIELPFDKERNEFRAYKC